MDGPAVGGRDLRTVVRHHAETVADHIEEVARRRLLQTLDVVARRALHAALHDHAVAAAGAPVGAEPGQQVEIGPYVVKYSALKVTDDGQKQMVTANVNVELALATLQETVTVTGASPIVDTSTTQVGTNFTKELLTEIRDLLRKK